MNFLHSDILVLDANAQESVVFLGPDGQIEINPGASGTVDYESPQDTLKLQVADEPDEHDPDTDFTPVRYERAGNGQVLLVLEIADSHFDLED